jgi:bacterioferritin
MCENWGYEKLSGTSEAIHWRDEACRGAHGRILFLEGSPSVQPLELTVGQRQRSVETILTSEQRGEEYNHAIQVAVVEKDNGSRDLFVQLLKDEENHVDWLEAQVHMIKELGYERYLTMQMGEDEE